MEPQIISYPIEVFYLTALIGVSLILFRPRWAFLFVVFCLAIRHYHMAVFTRTEVLGPFLNLNDLFLWIGVGALLRIAIQGQKIWAPRILLAIIAILLLGSFQSLVQYGFDYLVMQALWAAWVFPIMFFIGVNMVRNEQDARLFYWALFLGSAGAGLQHLFFVQDRALNLYFMLSAISSLRTISFAMSGGLFLVISAFFVDMRKILPKGLWLLWGIGLSFISLSYLLSFTRTVWLGGALSGAALFLLFYQEWRDFLYRLGYSLAILIIIFLGFQAAQSVLFADLELTQAVEERMEFLQHEDTFQEAYQSREAGMETELKLWQNGSLIWGVGGCYAPSLLESSIEERGALGHVAFSMYLAHFGLIGLLTYGFLLPIFTMRVGKQYFLRHRNDFGGVIAMAGIALALFDIFTLLSSNHYLSATSQVPGLLYGSLWGLSSSLQLSLVRNSANKVRLHQIPRQWLPEPVQQ